MYPYKRRKGKSQPETRTAGKVRETSGQEVDEDPRLVEGGPEDKEGPRASKVTTTASVGETCPSAKRRRILGFQELD